MWTLVHFGQEHRCTGSIGEAVGNLNINPTGDPYINGEQATIDATPTPGSRVTFRPRAAGKAK